jgi:hypothetical protein
MEKYPKFKDKKECAFPERDNCNWDESEGSKRCPYMKYNNSKSIFDSTRWECIYKKQENKSNNDKNKEDIKDNSKEIK